MDTVVIIAIASGALVVGFALGVWLLSARARRRDRTRRLRSYFGDEYEKAVAEKGRRDAEKDFEQRIEKDEVTPQRVPPDRREELTDRWRTIQYELLDDPTGSLRRAETLVVDAMADRGFDVDDMESRAAALSVERPELADEYRGAFDVYRRADEGSRSIEQTFEAVRTYREVFDAVLLRPVREQHTAEADAPAP